MSNFGDVIGHDCVRIERLVPGPIERVWRCITDPRKRRAWLGAGDIDLHPGGCVEIIVQDAGHLHESRIIGRVTDCAPPQLLGFRWDHGPPSEVRFELQTHGEKVLLTLTHQHPPSREDPIGIAAGWHSYFDILVFDILVARLPGKNPLRRIQTALETLYDKRIPPW